MAACRLALRRLPRPQLVGLVLGLSDLCRAFAMAARTFRSGRTYLAQCLAALADDVVRADADFRRPTGVQ